MEENEIKGGVIIIGSLFWEDEKNCVAGKEKEGKARRRWRERHLDVYKKQIVKLPTRYGRCSDYDNRRNTYTMVLSRDYLKKSGTGLIVPFNKIFSVRDKGKIGRQIKNLAKVEGITKNGDGALAKYWSAIAIWVNPNNKHSKEIIKYWRRYIVRGNKYGYTNQNGSIKNYDWSDTALIDNNFQLEL